MKDERNINALQAWQKMVGIEDYDTFCHYKSSSSYGARIHKCYCVDGRMYDFNGRSTDIQTVGFLINGLWSIGDVEKCKLVEMSVQEIKEKLGCSAHTRLKITSTDQ